MLTIKMQGAVAPQPPSKRPVAPSRHSVPGKYDLVVDRFMSVPVRIRGTLQIEPTAAPQGLRLTSCLAWPKYTSTLEESYNAAKGQYERQLSINGEPMAVGVCPDQVSAAERVWRYQMLDGKRSIVSRERFGADSWSQSDEFMPFVSTHMTAKRENT